MRKALVLIGVLVVIAIGVRLSLPKVGPAPSTMMDPGPSERMALAAEGPSDGAMAAGEAPASDPISAPVDDVGAALSPLQAEEARFEAMLNEVIGDMYFDRENPDLSALLTELERLWESGEPLAGLVISALLSNPEFGIHAPVNARLWLERAAEAGSLTAGVMLSTALLDGDPMQGGYDPARAVDLLERLLSDGVIEIAPTLLGIYAGDQIENGYLGDPRRAEALVETIRESGDGRVLLQLGGMYGDGFGGPDHRSLAVDAYVLAGENGAGEGFVRAVLIQLDCGENSTRDPDAAIGLMLRQIEAYGDNFSNRRLLANAYASSGRWDEAIAEQRRAIAMMEAAGLDAENVVLVAARAELESYLRFEATAVRACI
jgi:TPR repeat protein